MTTEVIELTQATKSAVEELLNKYRSDHDALREDIRKGHEVRESDRKKLASIEGKIQEIYDDVNDLRQKGALPSPSVEQKSFSEFIGQNEGYKKLVSEGNKEISIKVDRTDLAKMLKKEDVIGTQEDGRMFSTGFNEPEYDPNILIGARPGPTIRNLVPAVNTDKESFSYMRENGFTGEFQVVPEGTKKPQIGQRFTKEISQVLKIAGWQPITEETLSDVPAMRAYLENTMRYRLRMEEDRRFLKGKGGNTDFQGFMTVAPQFDSDRFKAETKLDLISWAITQADFDSDIPPDGIIMSKIDWNEIYLSKDKEGRYQFAQIQGMGTPLLWGRPVVTSNAMVDEEDRRTGQFLVGNFRLTSLIRDREQMNLRLGWVNEQFVHNEITILLEERVGLEIRMPGAFVQGTFPPKSEAEEEAEE